MLGVVSLSVVGVTTSCGHSMIVFPACSCELH